MTIYDSIDRLTDWTLTNTENQTTTFDEDYRYDANGNLSQKAGVNFTGYDTAHAHAVSAAGGNTYEYDCNGNMARRDINSGPLTGDYLLSYDAENRLVKVEKNGTEFATFMYDGDGRQVKATINGETTTYVGPHYEVKGSVVTKYYFAGTQRIAMRENGTLSYLLGDHLGSSSVTTDANGVSTATMLYKAWGEARYSTGSLNTKYQYTGQRNEVGIGLHFYNARWYDDQLGRFIQADSIVPGGVQGLDRYAYVGNSPARYIDPSGHTIACTGDRWDDGPQCFGRTREELLDRLDITIDDDMPDEYVGSIIAAGIDDGGFWAESMGLSAESAFSEKHGGITIEYDPNCYNCRNVAVCGDQMSGYVGDVNCTPGGAYTDNAHHITIASMSVHADARVLNMVHEFGHTFNDLNEWSPVTELEKEHPDFITDRPLILRPNPGYLLWQQNTALNGSETFADLYIAEVYGVWNLDPNNALNVQSAQIWMNKWMR